MGLIRELRRARPLPQSLDKLQQLHILWGRQGCGLTKLALISVPVTEPADGSNYSVAPGPLNRRLILHREGWRRYKLLALTYPAHRNVRRTRYPLKILVESPLRIFCRDFHHSVINDQCPLAHAQPHEIDT